MNAPDEELAVHARRGNQDAFATLVTRHQGRMYGLALRMLRNPDDADDAAQEAFLRCYSALHRYNPQHSFGAWLYRIGYNFCLDTLRRRRHAAAQPVHSNRTEDVLAAAPDPGPGVEDAVLRKLSVDSMGQAVDSLSNEHRDVLVLRYTAGLSYAEMAQVLEVSESVVTMRLHHAKRALRSRMIALGEGVDGAS